MGRYRSQKAKKKEFLSCLEESGGIVEAACSNSGVGRTNVYRWRQNDPKFAKEWDVIRDAAATLVESKLMQSIASGNITAIIYYLNNKGKSLGYNAERQEVNVNIKPIEDLSTWAKEMDDAFTGVKTEKDKDKPDQTP